MLYFGPETYLPLASAVAAGAGAVMIFWRRFLGLTRRVSNVVFRRRRSKAAPPKTRPPLNS